MDWRPLAFGIVLIIVLGVGGLVYRNAVERVNQPVACPADAKVCPDGTSVAREGLSCTFPTCPPPNVSIASAGISFAIPNGFTAEALFNTEGIIAAYTMLSNGSSSPSSEITIRGYTIAASSTALATIQATAINGASGAPVPTTGYSSTNIGDHRFTVVELERFEGVVDTAYYLARAGDVLRFDAIDHGADWTNPNLDPATLPAHGALLKLLATLQGE